ncbi:hypothetical protein QOT17_024971 [Balamuthia mandrillaris]
MNRSIPFDERRIESKRSDRDRGRDERGERGQQRRSYWNDGYATRREERGGLKRGWREEEQERPQQHQHRPWEERRGSRNASHMTTRGGRGGGRGGRGAGHDMRKRQRQSLDDPVSVPRRGYFFEHDDRGSNRTSNNPQQHLNTRGGDLRSAFRSSSDTFHYRPYHRGRNSTAEEREVKWGHDKFEELQAEEEEGGPQPQQHHQKDNRSRRRREEDDEEEKRKGKEDQTRRKGEEQKDEKSAAKNEEDNEQTNKVEGEEAEEEL